MFRSVESVKSYLRTQLRDHRDELPAHRKRRTHPFITLSRQSGAGSFTVTEHLAQRLTEKGIGKPKTPWVVFDRSLLERVIEMHELPEEFMKYMEERVAPGIQSAMEEFFNLHPSTTQLVGKMNRTILHLASMGNAIIVGRGSAIVTRELGGGLHIRMVGSAPIRCQNLTALHELDPEEAQKRMTQVDADRASYVKKYFGRLIDDPLLYDLVLNTDRWRPEATARLILNALKRKLS